MGSFYVNHTVRACREAVAPVLEAEGRTAFVGPTEEGCTVVCDRECDRQDEEVIVALGRRLSARLGEPALAVLNHDDDLLCYWLFERGQLTERYHSCPGFFAEDEPQWPRLYREDGADEGAMAAVPLPENCGAALCRAFGKPERERQVQAVLAEHGQRFALFTHRNLVRALGLPPTALASGYRNVAQGDAELDPDDCIHVGSHSRALVR